MRGMSFACVMGVTAILIHSWVDFNLQIPANAVFFMVLLALGWISLYLDRRGRRRAARDVESRRMRILVTGAAGFIGFHLAKRLLERGDTVVGLDNLNDYYDVALKEARLERAADAARRFTFVRADLARPRRDGERSSRAGSSTPS